MYEKLRVNQMGQMIGMAEVEEDTPLQPGETALVQLKYGDIVNIPVEYLQPLGPESEADDETVNMRRVGTQCTVIV